MDEKMVIELNGRKFQNFTEFVEHCNDRLFDKFSWNGSLDAFNDLLRGGFGNCVESSKIRWINGALAREALGFPQTVKWLQAKLQTCHPSNRKNVMLDIKNAECSKGQTLFDMVLEIIESHCHGVGKGQDVQFELVE